VLKSKVGTIKAGMGFFVAAVLLPTTMAWGANLEKSKSLFAEQCASCHGSGGKGDGPAAAALTPKPHDLTDKQHMAAVTDQYLTDIIKKGGAAVGKSAVMAPFGDSMSDADIADMVAYLRSLAK